jgi:hypothetical protein
MTADGHEVVYSRAESVAAVVVGSASEIVAQNVDTGRIRPTPGQQSNEIVEILSDDNSARYVLRARTCAR